MVLGHLARRNAKIYDVAVRVVEAHRRRGLIHIALEVMVDVPTLFSKGRDVGFVRRWLVPRLT